MTSERRLEQIRAWLAGTAFKDAQLHPLAGDASFRRCIRLQTPQHSAMLMDAPPGKEDVRPFVSAAEYLHARGFSAPAILERDVDAGLLVLEDLGDASFTALLKAGRVPELQLYEAAIDVLAQWHGPQEGFSNPGALPLPVYDETLLLREVELFADWFLPQALGAQKAALLKPDYMALWRALLADAPLATTCWVHRDYHADNLMWLPEREGLKRVGLLDFQDGVYGDAAYDLVSLLEDARRDVSTDLAEAMIERYVRRSTVNPAHFRRAYAILAAQRNSKIVGIFARLAVRDRKPHYLHYLPRVWEHLERDATHPALAPLRQWLDTHVPAEHRGVLTLRQGDAA